MSADPVKPFERDRTEMAVALMRDPTDRARARFSSRPWRFVALLTLCLGTAACSSALQTTTTVPRVTARQRTEPKVAPAMVQDAKESAYVPTETVTTAAPQPPMTTALPPSPYALPDKGPWPTPPPDEEAAAPPPPEAVPEEKPEFAEEKPTPPPKRAPASETEPGVRQLGRVKLYYATDRKWTGARKQPKWFGADWNDAKEHLTYGTCEVSIPVQAHKPGVVEKLSTIQIILGAEEDPKKHVMVKTADRLDRSTFFDTFGAEVSRRSEKEIIVFIHGFNNTFDDAASRLAVLAYDMDFNGVPVLYSWSSQGGLLGWNPIAYVRDEQTVTKTDDLLTDFLASITQRARAAGAVRVNVVAHSMGNRALLAALRNLAKRDKDKIVIDEVVMAAPDVPEPGFAKELWPSLQPSLPSTGPAKRITLYASSDDKALSMSKALHGGLGRIGETRPNLLLLPGLDTIDASGCDFHRFGLNHTYFGGGKVISDLAQIIQKGLAPLDRQLQGRKVHDLSYWLLPEVSTR